MKTSRIPDNFVGVHHQYRHEVLSFAKLLEQGRNAVEASPAQYVDVDLGRGETVRCLKNGLWLLRDEGGPCAVLLAQQHDYGRSGDSSIEIMAVPGEHGAVLARVLCAGAAALQRQLLSWPPLSTNEFQNDPCEDALVGRITPAA